MPFRAKQSSPSTWTRLETPWAAPSRTASTPTSAHWTPARWGTSLQTVSGGWEHVALTRLSKSSVSGETDLTPWILCFLRNAKPLNLMSCSSEQKQVLYEIANASFSSQRTSPNAFYNLIQPYLGEENFVRPRGRICFTASSEVKKENRTSHSAQNKHRHLKRGAV